MTAAWDDIVGQPAAVRVLRAALAAGEIGHAWLFVGPGGAGQGLAARAFAAALNCPESAAPDAGCGSCRTCRRIARRAHPAVRDFEPEGAYHRVGTVREDWIPASTTTPVEGRTKVLRIVEADRMNEIAQNAFLKALEEPPPFTVWILEAEDDQALLETVSSRCRRVDFTPPDRAAMRELAGRAGVDEEDREVLARAAMGSPRRLQVLAEGGAAARDDHLGLLARLAEEGPGAAPAVAGELISWSKARAKDLAERHERELDEIVAAYGVERTRDLPAGVKTRVTTRQDREAKQASADALSQVLDDLGSYLRDVLAVAGGAGEAAVVNVDRLEDLRRDADRLGPSGAAAGLRRIAAARDALDRNGHTQLQMERLLLHLALAVR